MLRIDPEELTPSADYATVRMRLWQPEAAAEMEAKRQAETLAKLKAEEERERIRAMTEKERFAKAEADRERAAELVEQFREVALSVNRRLTARQIILEVAQKHRITTSDLVGPWRKAKLVRARQEAMWRMRHETQLSYPQIGQKTGGRDHTTALAAVRRHQGRLDKAAAEAAAAAMVAEAAE